MELLRRLDRRMDRWRQNVTKWFRKKDKPLQIEPFRGFTNGKEAYFQGRLLEYKPLFDQWESGWHRNLVNSFRRFASKEVPDANIEIQFGPNQIQLTTDEEGYFILDDPLSEPLGENGKGWIDAFISLKEAPGRETQEVNRKGQLLLPDQTAKLGMISDIDDTLLQTGVTSPMKWRVFYLTFLMSISSRKPVQASGQFYRRWHRSPTPQRPIFYVSNSPWNLYDLLRDFMRFNGFPKGPILLRDVGIPYRSYPKEFPTHKEYTISRILSLFPKMKFILVGDSGEKDAVIYLRMADMFPNQIAAILIRKINAGKRSKRIQALFDTKDRPFPTLLFSTYEEVLPFLATHHLG